jgi:hypothetical protein
MTWFLVLSLSATGCEQIARLRGTDKETKAAEVFKKHQKALDALESRGRESAGLSQRLKKYAESWAGKDVEGKAYSGSAYEIALDDVTRFAAEVDAVRKGLAPDFTAADLSEEHATTAWTGYWEKRGVTVDTARHKEVLDNWMKTVSLTDADLSGLIERAAFDHWKAQTPGFEGIESAFQAFTIYPAVGVVNRGGLSFRFSRPATFDIHFRRGIELRAAFRVADLDHRDVSYSIVLQCPLLLKGTYYPRETQLWRDTVPQWYR